MDPLSPTSAWIYSRLAPSMAAHNYVDTYGDVRIYDELADEGTAYPFIIIILQSPGGDVLTLNGNRVWSNPLFQVAAVDETETWETVQPLADEIDAQLHQTRGSTASIRIESCIRERPHRQVILDDGRRYAKLGGLYRIKVMEA